ncbi:tyrosine-type recombinase/integrase [Leptospira stimsonii]|uniref:tyrosine-type recombinase/integrase n=1 Tax=Leptospira stimsonii TaxID=2202203 RepID=UPI001FEFD946|nr:tyrosine-type recombinase/integrase [Leptospira stimsonii]
MGDIDFERKTIFISEAKGNKERYGILSNQAASLLEQYLNSYKPISYLFYSSKGRDYSINIRGIQIAFKRICKEAGIKKNAKVHSLRHSFATHLLEDGYSILYIQRLLGHTSLNSTLIYLHLNPNFMLNIRSPFEKIDSPKMGIFDTHSQHELGLQFS